MDKAQRKLLVEQLDKKLDAFSSSVNTLPDQGWIASIRAALNMSLDQLGKRIGIKTRAGVLRIEEREQDKSITLKSLDQVAHALDMKLVYGFVPKTGSLDTMIEKRAYEQALEIVKKTSENMTLEDQENSKERLQKAIKEKQQDIIRELPRHLWD